MIRKIDELISEKITGEWGSEPKIDRFVNVLRTTNFTNEGKLKLDSVVTRDIDDKKILKKQLLFGDTIIEKSGGSPKQPVGRVVFFNIKGGTYLCNNFTSVLRPSEKILPKYLFYSLFYLHVTKRTLGYQNKTTGIINLQLDRYLKSESIYLPNKAQQEQVIKSLDEADKIIQKRKLSMTMLEEYLRSVFLEMFGDPLANPKQFPLSKLETFYVDTKTGTKCGPFGSALKKDEFTSNGIPVWNMDNISPSGRMSLPFRMWISPEKYKSLLAYSVQDGDVLISRAGTVGKMCVARIEGESIISTNLIRVRFGDKLLPQYFVSLMNYCMDRLGRLKTGGDGSFTHMNTGVLDNLIFPYPPIELQEKFVEIYKKTEELRKEMAQQSVELDNSYHGLMQKAFMPSPKNS